MIVKFYTYIFLIFFGSISSFASDCPDLGAVGRPGYPIGYAEWVSNTAAVVSILGQFYNLLGIRCVDCFRAHLDKEIEEKIEAKLHNSKNSKSNIAVLLAKIITSFDNGIDAGEDRYALYRFAAIRSLISTLDENKCKICIDDFVKIVSAKVENAEASKQNLENFEIFLEKSMYVKCKCNNKVQSSQSSMYNSEADQCCQHCCGESQCCSSMIHAFRDKWTHPFHYSSLCMAGGCVGLSAGLACCLPSAHLAGAFVGDVANMSSILNLLTPAFAMFQNCKQMKRDEKKVWHAELDRIIEANCGLIEIFGQIIGKMPNDISYREAKGYIKAFLIIGWNSELEAQFVAVASAHNKNKMDFVTNIHKEVKEIPYHDPDIQFAIYDKIAPIQDSPVTQEMVMTDSSETSLINTARYNEYGGTSK